METASEIRMRILREAGPEEGAALLQGFKDIQVPTSEISARQSQCERVLLPKGRIGMIFWIVSPEYGRMIDILTHPAADARNRLISGYPGWHATLKAVIIFARVAFALGILLLITAFFRGWAYAILGLGLWLVWSVVLNPLQTILNLQGLARLTVYDEHLQKGQPIVMEIT